MNWRDYICRTPVIVACYLITVMLLLIKTLLLRNSDSMRPLNGSEIAENGASIRSLIHSSTENDQLFATEPEIPARDVVWQDVDGLTYVYSAYYDDRLKWPKTIRIIGVTKRYKDELLRCKFWFANREFSATTKARVRILPGHKNKFKCYSACFILCPFTSEGIPVSVSVITHQKRLKNHLLVINTKKNNNTTPPSKKSAKIGICVKPLYNNYNDSVQLVEFMELNQLFGVDHVTFYKSSISITTDCILKNYIDERRATLVTAMPWNSSPQAVIMNENGLAALNDCMYRNMHNFTYVAFLDMDEFIVPVQNDTIQRIIEMLDSQADEMPYGIGSYSFRNGFLYLEWPDDANTAESHDEYARSLTTLLKTTQRVQPHGTRSKFIVKPTNVQEVGYHRVTKFLLGSGDLNVSENEGVLYHYRACEYGGSKCTGEASQVDRTVFRYKHRLVAAVKRRWEKLKNLCGMEDIHKAKSTRLKMIQH